MTDDDPSSIYMLQVLRERYQKHILALKKELRETEEKLATLEEKLKKKVKIMMGEMLP